MGVKITNDISSKSTHQIHCQKDMHIPTEGIYQSYSKNCEISYFGFLPIFSSGFKQSLYSGWKFGFLPSVSRVGDVRAVTPDVCGLFFNVSQE